jgi:hypothetical protein
LKWGLTLGLAVVVWGLIRYDWRRMDAGMKKEKAAFIGITFLASLLSVLLVWLPRMPSAMKWIDAVFGPLSSFLKT